MTTAELTSTELTSGVPPQTEDWVAWRARIDERMRHMATKADLADLRGELKGDLADLRGELKSDLGDLRAELKADHGDLKVWMLKTMVTTTVTTMIGFGALIVAAIRLLP